MLKRSGLSLYLFSAIKPSLALSQVQPILRIYVVRTLDDFSLFLPSYDLGRFHLDIDDVVVYYQDMLCDVNQRRMLRQLRVAVDVGRRRLGSGGAVYLTVL
jgi:hypothetical protein